MARILVVDDDTSVVSGIQMVLEDVGFDVIVAYGGRSALEVLEGTRVNVIIIDMLMPGTDAFETMREFCRRAPTVPIIAMSGFRSSLKKIPDVLAMAMDAGAAFCLQKPFDATRLIAAIRAVSAFTLPSGTLSKTYTTREAGRGSELKPATAGHHYRGFAGVERADDAAIAFCTTTV